MDIDDVSCGGTTPAELRRLALALLASCFTRHWLHYNFPNRRMHLMAISYIDHEGNPASVEEREMERLGFARWTEADGLSWSG
jgi:hypothetical protein